MVASNVASLGIFFQKRPSKARKFGNFVIIGSWRVSPTSKLALRPLRIEHICHSFLTKRPVYLHWDPSDLILTNFRKCQKSVKTGILGGFGTFLKYRFFAEFFSFFGQKLGFYAQKVENFGVMTHDRLVWFSFWDTHSITDLFLRKVIFLICLIH